ncbi:MAG TPA: hypothetical protein VFE52_11550 [Devosia sp.]|jgi:hypothetical protein|nr:hypothetical protein [Devosia sp.]
MTDTVIIPPDGRRVRRGSRFIPPLLVIPFLFYNILAVTMMGWQPNGWNAQLLTIPMVSGASWSLTWSDLLLLVGLVCLFFEVVKSTNTGRNSVIEHMASTALFVVFLVEFLLFAPAASSTFFILMAMSLVDVVAGFTISITGAGRDVTMGE